MRLDPLRARFGYGVAGLVLPAEPYRPARSPLSLSRGALCVLGEASRDLRAAARLLWNGALALLVALVAAALVWSSLAPPDDPGVQIVAFETTPPEPAREPPEAPVAGVPPEPAPEPVPEPAADTPPEPRSAPEPPRPRPRPEPVALALAPPLAPAVLAPRVTPASRREAPPLQSRPPLRPLVAPASPAPDLPVSRERLARAARPARPEPGTPAPRVAPVQVPEGVPPAEAPRWRAARDPVSRIPPARSARPDLVLAAPAGPVEQEPPSPSRSARAAPPSRPAAPSLSASALALPATRPPAPAAPAPGAPAPLPVRDAPQTARGRRPGGRKLRGVPLGSLAACVSDREEERLKQRLIAAVTAQGECASEAGRYRFLETRNLNAFLMTVERAPGRPEADRCAELAHALECVAGRESGRR